MSDFNKRCKEIMERTRNEMLRDLRKNLRHRQDATKKHSGAISSKNKIYTGGTEPVVQIKSEELE